MRDARGRRKSVCIGSSEIVEAGLSSLVGGSAAITTSRNEDDTMDQTASASSLAPNIKSDEDESDLQHARGEPGSTADAEGSPGDAR